MSQGAIIERYRGFLEEKKPLDAARGLDVPAEALNPALKDHVKVGVQWALRGGRRAFFWSFGMAKTSGQLEFMRLLEGLALAAQELGEPCLRGIVLPLNVVPEFVDEVALRFSSAPYQVRVKFVQRTEDLEGPDVIHLMNYEAVREGKVDLARFFALSLDEAAVLRSFGSKTFGEFLFGPAMGAVYKLVATATPDPNEFLELIAYAHFLGVMDMGEAKTRFFKRNSEKADDLTLNPAKEEEFWLWVASWAMFLQKPSDLGFSDEGYELPPLEVHWHELPSDHQVGAGEEKNGQQRLLKTAAIGVTDAAREKRESLPARVDKLLELRALDPDGHRIIWHDLEAEREALEDALPAAVYRHWHEYKDGNPRALAIFDRHYTSRRAHVRKQDQFVGPGGKLVLLTAAADALFAWREHISDAGQQGVCCAVFRNEGPTLSSELIREAMHVAWQRWPGQRLYTYVDPDEVESPNPGYCFKEAGWKKCGQSKDGLVILEAFPPAEGWLPFEHIRRPWMASVYGSQDLGERVEIINRFRKGELAELAAKPVMLGAGGNLQHHCAWAVFLGIGHKFADFIQAIHRLRRYGQRRRVRVDIIYTEAERPVRANLEGKWKRHEEQTARMAELIRRYGLGRGPMHAALSRSMGVERREEKGERWALVNNDSVLELAVVEDNRFGMFLTSIPFSTQYEYSPSYNDFGHTDDDAHFWAQMDFLTPNVHRTLKPGRILAVHCKDRIVPGALNGIRYQTVSLFTHQVAAHYQRHGFRCIGYHYIDTDVVTENEQTYRLGYSNVCKDATRIGAGLPELLLIFRKDPTDASQGWADERVLKVKREWDRKTKRWTNREGYSCARWQYDAHAHWRSSGNRLLSPEDLRGMALHQVVKLFKKYSLENVYDHEEVVAIAEAMDEAGQLRHDFFVGPPQSGSHFIWSDVFRAATLNMDLARRNAEKHLCPLQFDVVERAISLYSNKDDEIGDFFAGVGTVPLIAMRMGRRGWGCELAPRYFDEAVKFMRREERGLAQATLFGEEAA